MANLYREFLTERETGASTARAVANITTKPNLSAEDVVDSHAWNKNSFMRYVLRDADSLQQTITELQIFIQKMAALIPERSKYFIVDPGDNGMHLLQGSQTLAQLPAAWTMISKRMEAAQRFILKYQEEYKGTRVPLSLVSTATDLHQQLEDLTVYDDRLRYMYSEFPHHNVAQTAADHREIKADRNWDYIVTVPHWMKEVVANEPEDDYEPTISSLGRHDEEQEPERTELEREETANRCVSFFPVHTAPPDIPLLGTGTPFESQSSFFQNPKGDPIAPFPKHRRAQHQADPTNLLHGLATPSGPSSFQMPRFNPSTNSMPWAGGQTTSSIWGNTRAGPSGVDSANWRAPGSKALPSKEGPHFTRDLPPHQG